MSLGGTAREDSDGLSILDCDMEPSTLLAPGAASFFSSSSLTLMRGMGVTSTSSPVEGSFQISLRVCSFSVEVVVLPFFVLVTTFVVVLPSFDLPITFLELAATSN